MPQPAVTVYSDSKSSVQHLQGMPHNICDQLSKEIWDLTYSLRSSGSLTKVVWIPSHVAILLPSAEEVYAEVQQQQNLQWLSRLQASGTLISSGILKVGLDESKFLPDRRSSVALHRLRTGRNSLSRIRRTAQPAQTIRHQSKR